MAPNMFDLLLGEDDRASEENTTPPEVNVKPKCSSTPHKNATSRAVNEEGFSTVKAKKKGKSPKKATTQTQSSKLKMNTAGKPTQHCSGNVAANQSRMRIVPVKSLSTTTNGPVTQKTGAPRQQEAAAILKPPVVSPNSVGKIVKSVGPQPPKPRYAAPKLAPLRLADEPNVRAINDWRARKPATLSYELPKNFDPRLQSKDVVISNTGRAFPMFDHVAAKTGTHIVLDIPKGRTGQTIAKIWGTQEDAREAIQWITHWIWLHFPQAHSKAKFPKMPSLTDNEWWQLEQDAKRDELRQRFRLPIPEGLTFTHRIIVGFPDVDWHLPEVLGARFEALDSLRTEYLVYITYTRSPQDADVKEGFEVLGVDGEGAPRIKAAIRRIKAIPVQQDARQLDRPTWWMVKQVKSAHMKQLVRLEPYQGPSALAFNQGTSSSDHSSDKVGTALKPVLAGSLLVEAEMQERLCLAESAEVGMVCIGNTGVNELNLKNLEATVSETLEILTHYKGYLRMRAWLGKGVLTKYRRNEDGSTKHEYNLSEFESMLYSKNRNESPLIGHVTKELGDLELEGQNMLQRFERSTCLIPCGARSSKMQALKPVYCATFIVADQNLQGVFYRLELEWEEKEEKEEGGGFERTKRLWLRLEQNETDMTPLMEVNILDLEGGLSQHLGISAANAIDDARIPQHWHIFVDDVKLKLEVAADPRDTRSFFRWPLRPEGTPTIPIVSLEQKRAWRFSFLTTDYVVEVATLQDAYWSKQTNKPTAYEMRWGVSIWHSNWDMWLPENGHLGLGEEARWKADEWFLFPAQRKQSITGENSKGHRSTPEELEDMEAESMLFQSGSGFRTLMEKLNIVEDIITGRETADRSQRKVSTQPEDQLQGISDASSTDGSISDC